MDARSKDAFHVIHKVPAGDGPYVRAKRMQVVEKDHEAAIVWFWKAINSGDRVDSALKDMAVVMNQQDRAEEAIEAIESFRHRCSRQAQEPLDNLLVDLYKKCGRSDDHIRLLKRKLRAMHQGGGAFDGKATKTARSHGRKVRVSVRQETARILGNLGWAYMQQSNYDAAEVVYRKAQVVEPDANRACNLGLCLMKKGRFVDARRVLEDVVVYRRFSDGLGSEEGDKSVSHAKEMMREMAELERRSNCASSSSSSKDMFMSLEEEEEEEDLMESVEAVMNEWTPFRSRRLPIFEEISSLRDQNQMLDGSLACQLL